MKVAVLFRGPMRPSEDTIRANIATVLDELRGLEFTSFLVTWEGEQTDYLGDLIEHITHLPIPDVPDMGKFPTGHSRRNAFLQYYSTPRALDVIPDDFDWIVYVRQDIHIRLNDRSDWFTPGFYNTAHVEPFICDQVAVAEASVMRRAWRYPSKDELTEHIGATARAEDTLSRLLSQNGVEARTCYCDERHITRT